MSGGCPRTSRRGKDPARRLGRLPTKTYVLGRALGDREGLVLGLVEGNGVGQPVGS